MPLSSPYYRTALATVLSVAAALVIVTQQSAASASVPAAQAETLPVRAAAAQQLRQVETACTHVGRAQAR